MPTYTIQSEEYNPGTLSYYFVEDGGLVHWRLDVTRRKSECTYDVTYYEVLLDDSVKYVVEAIGVHENDKGTFCDRLRTLGRWPGGGDIPAEVLALIPSEQPRA